MTVVNPEIVMFTDVICFQDLDTDRLVGWHSTLMLASYTRH